MKKYMKPSEYAKIYSMNQRTVVNNFHKGWIKGKQDEQIKTIYILNPEFEEYQVTLDEKRFQLKL